MRNNEIMENIYEKNLHREMVRRSFELPQFLIKHNALRKQDIQLIWNASINEHESIISVIYPLIINLIDKLNKKQLEYLFGFIKDLPRSQYNPSIMLLIKKITFHGLSFIHSKPVTSSPKSTSNSSNTSLENHREDNENINEVNYFGLPVVWELIQDDHAVSEEIKLQALQQLIEFLSRRECYSQIEYYIELSIDNIKKNHSIIPSIQLLRHIIIIYSNTLLKDYQLKYSSKVGGTGNGLNHSGGSGGGSNSLGNSGGASGSGNGGYSSIFGILGNTISLPLGLNLQYFTSEIIYSLNEKRNLLELLILELIRYKTMFQEYLINHNYNPTSNDTMELRVINKNRCHSSELNERLNFLQFFLTQCKRVKLNTEQLDALWDVLISKSSSVIERDISFRWFDIFRFSPECRPVIFHLFPNKFHQLSFHNISFFGFQFVKSYFELYHIFNQNIHVVNNYFTYQQQQYQQYQLQFQQLQISQQNNMKASNSFSMGHTPSSSPSITSLDRQSSPIPAFSSKSPSNQAIAPAGGNPPSNTNPILNHNNYTLTISNFDKLDGIDLLWNIAIESDNEDIRKSVILYFIKLLKSFAPSIQSTLPHHGKLFINKLIQKIKIASNEYTQSNKIEDKNIILRCITILQYLVQEFKSSSSSTSNTAPSKPNLRIIQPADGNIKDKIRLKIIAQSQSQQQPSTDEFMIYFALFEYISSLKQFISIQLHLSKEYKIRLISNGKELEDKYTLMYYHIKSGQTIYVNARSQSLSAISPFIRSSVPNSPSLSSSSPSTQSISSILLDFPQPQPISLSYPPPTHSNFSPSSILSGSTANPNNPSDGNYFNELFQLLTIKDDDIPLRVWDLLVLLPLHQQIINTIHNYRASNTNSAGKGNSENNTVDEKEKDSGVVVLSDNEGKRVNENMEWGELLPMNCLFKLLYSLQIIHANVTNQVQNTMNKGNNHSIESNTNPKKFNWNQWFIEAGGLHHLFDIFQNFPLKITKNNKLFYYQKKTLFLLLKIISHFTLHNNKQYLTIKTDLLFKPNPSTTNNNNTSSSSDTTTIHNDTAHHSRFQFTEEQFLRKILGLIEKIIRYSQFNYFNLHPQREALISRSNSLNNIMNVNPSTPSDNHVNNLHHSANVQNNNNNNNASNTSKNILDALIGRLIDLLIGGCNSSNEIAIHFLHYKKLPRWILSTMIQCKFKNIREIIGGMICDIFTIHLHKISSTSACSLFNQLTSLFYNELGNIKSETVKDYFQLIQLMIEKFTKKIDGLIIENNQEKNQESVNHEDMKIIDCLNKFIENLCKKIMNYQSIECGSNVDIDYQLISILKIFKQLFQCIPEFKKQFGSFIIHELFSKYLFSNFHSRATKLLFPSPSSRSSPFSSITPSFSSPLPGAIHQPKCKNKLTRKYCFEIFEELIKSNDFNRMLILCKLIENHTPFEFAGEKPNHQITPSPLSSNSNPSSTFPDHPPSVKSQGENLQYHGTLNKRERKQLWNYNPISEEKSISGFVGLLNLGATCYMNSLLQQFYMIPNFRFALLSIEFPSPSPTTSLSISNSSILHPNNNNSTEEIINELELDKMNEEREVSVSKEENKSKMLIFQLKRMFSYLQESEKKSFDTRDFCKAYGSLIQQFNPALQMDVDEFFSEFFNQLENILKLSGRENVISDIFTGKICNQIISKECDHISETTENFYTLPVTIKSLNKPSLEESLDLFIKGDTLDGNNKYHCSTCNKKVTALKRHCIEYLPNRLIIHLKRFEYDLELMRRVKLNDYYQFPFYLNLQKYTKEHLDEKKHEIKEQSYYEYELVGILVHSGTADSGHYYSFIKNHSTSKPVPSPPPPTSTTTVNNSSNNPEDGKASMNIDLESHTDKGSAMEEEEEELWYQFNDDVVQVIDKNDIPAQCFGGTETIMQYDNVQRKNVPQYRVRSNNAYMLFYKRIIPTITSSDVYLLNKSASSQPTPCEMPNKKAEMEVNSDLSSKSLELINTGRKDLRNSNDLVNLLVNNKKEFIEKEIYTSIWEENQLFLRDRYLFDSDYFQFIKHLMKIEEESMKQGSSVIEHHDKLDKSSLLFKTIELGSQFLNRTLVYAKERDILPSFMKILENLFERNIQACKWYLQKSMKHQWCKTILLNCTVAPVRSLYSNFIIKLLKLLSSHEKQFYFQCEDGSSPVVEDQKEIVFDENVLNHYQCKYKSKSIVIQYMDGLVDLLSVASDYWQHFAQYFTVFYHFAHYGGIEEKKYILSRSLCSRFIDFYLGNQSIIPNIKSRIHATTLLSEKHSNISYLIDFLKEIISHCTFDKQPNLSVTDYYSQRPRAIMVNQYEVILQGPGDNEHVAFKMNALDYLHVHNIQFYCRILTEKQNKLSSIKIIELLMNNNLLWSKEFILKLIDCFKLCKYDCYIYYFDCLNNCLLIEDQYKQERCEFILQQLYDLINTSLPAHPLISYEIIKIFVSWSKLYPFIFNYLLNKFPEWYFNWLINNNLDLIRESSFQLIKYALDTLKINHIYHLQQLSTFTQKTELKKPFNDFGSDISILPISDPIYPNDHLDMMISDEPIPSITPNKKRPRSVFEDDSSNNNFKLIAPPITLTSKNELIRQLREEEATENEIYRLLLTLIPILKSQISNEVHKYSLKADEEYISSPCKLIYYFQLMKYIIKEPKDIEVLFSSYLTEFLDLFLEIDRYKIDTDENKVYMLELWNHIVDISLNYSVYLTSTNCIEYLLSFRICLNPKYFDYLKKYLFNYFRLLRVLCEFDDEFLNCLLSHNNFTWAIDNICLNKVFSSLSDEIIKIISIIVTKNTNQFSPQRNSLISNILQKSNQTNYSYEISLELLNLLLENDENIVHFCNMKGLDCISQFPDILDEEGILLQKYNLPSILNFLKIFIKSTTWLLKGSDQAKAIQQQLKCRIIGYLPILRYYLDLMTNENVLNLTYQLLMNFSKLDLSFFDNLLQFLLHQHESFFSFSFPSLVNSFQSSSSSEMRTSVNHFKPLLKPHYPNPELSFSLSYYTFLFEFCQLAEGFMNNNDLLRSIFALGKFLYFPLFHSISSNFSFLFLGEQKSMLPWKLFRPPLLFVFSLR